MSDLDEDFFIPDLRDANMRHDTAEHSVSMDRSARYGKRSFTNIVGKELSDRKIDQYAERGWYSAAFKDARRELWQKQALKRQAREESRRDGNFLVFKDGRKVYSPL